MQDKKLIPIPKLLEERSQLRGDLKDIQPIATGGMAIVFKARQTYLNRYVAIKSLKTHLLENQETRERFRREAKALASILHQNVAHVYDFTETTDEALIFMEYIDGMDLSLAIQKIGALPAEIAAAILLGVSRGVAYLHDNHLIHRDIKPSNIRLTSRGEVKLMDFGIVMDTENHTLTRPGMMVGSPSYLSPEQVLGDPLNYQSDIFLLGICLYEMMTGTRPFREEGNKTIFQKIRDCDYIPANEMNRSIPKRLNRMIECCLEKDPRDRYQTVDEMIQELESFLGANRSNRTQDIILRFFDEEALLTPAIPYSEEITGEHQLTSKKTFITGVLAALLILTGIGLGYLIARWNPASQSLPFTAKPLK